MLYKDDREVKKNKYKTKKCAHLQKQKTDVKIARMDFVCFTNVVIARACCIR